MKGKALSIILLLGLVGFILMACGAEKPIDVAAITSQPKAYVGADTCKMCHLEHYDSWKMTMHSRMLQDAKKNEDAIIVPIDEKRIREDLAKLGSKLKVPADQIYVCSTGVIGERLPHDRIVAKVDELVANVDAHGIGAAARAHSRPLRHLVHR